MDGNLPSAVVYVVDDERIVRSAIGNMLAMHGYEPRLYSCAHTLLDSEIDSGGRPACMLLDIGLPGMTGPELQDQLVSLGCRIPIIAMTGAGDLGASVKMVRDGAIDLLEKPFTTQALLQLIRKAHAMDARRRQDDAVRQQALERLALLSPREREVLEQVCAGKTTKQIAAEFEIGVQTIAKHKARILEKCKVRNELELMRFVLQDAAVTR